MHLRISNQPYDVFIIGGGISACSAAESLTAAGYSVLLVEKDDFGSAASGRSSRLLHCGLRYLTPKRSPLEFLLRPDRFLNALNTARRSSKAVDEMTSGSPAEIRKTKLLLPILKSSTFRGWQADAGAKLLEIYANRKTKLDYTRYPASDAARLPFVPWLRERADIESVVALDDHQFVRPERMCVDAALAAEQCGATVLNYTAATTVVRDGSIWRATLEDMQSRCTAQVSARMVLNLAGVWVDEVQRNVETGERAKAARKIIGIKGVSIVVRLPEQCRGVGIAGINRHNEPIMVVPWGDVHYVGPTETVYEGDIVRIGPAEEDIESLISELTYFMPGLPVARSDVLQAWAGLRPMTYNPAYPTGQRMPFSVVYDLEKEGFPKAATMSWAAFMLHKETARKFVKLVGQKIGPSGHRLPNDATLSRRRPSDTSLPALTTFDAAAVTRAVQLEKARTIYDVLFRRTAYGWYSSISDGVIDATAEILQAHLSWSASEKAGQIRMFKQLLSTQHLSDGRMWSAKETRAEGQLV